MPIIHLVTTYRDVGGDRRQSGLADAGGGPQQPRKNVLRHNMAGLPGCAIMPRLHEPCDMIVDTKKRYDCFKGTDLDLSLRSHGVDTVLITGINTNSCVLAPQRPPAAAIMR